MQPSQCFYVFKQAAWQCLHFHLMHPIFQIVSCENRNIPLFVSSSLYSNLHFSLFSHMLCPVFYLFVMGALVSFLSFHHGNRWKIQRTIHFICYTINSTVFIFFPLYFHFFLVFFSMFIHYSNITFKPINNTVLTALNSFSSNVNVCVSSWSISVDYFSCWSWGIFLWLICCSFMFTCPVRYLSIYLLSV